MPEYPGIYASAGAGSAPQVHGLIDFGTNAGTKYYSIDHIALLDLPAGAWAIGFWFDVDDNAGSNFQYLISSGSFGATPSFNFYLNEASVATHAGKWQIRTRDDAGTDTGTSARSSSTDNGDGTERLLVIQSTGTTVEMWTCVGGAATKVMDEATDLGALTAPSAWNFGRRDDGDADRAYENQVGGLFWADVALDETTIESINTAGEPVSVLGANCLEYWPFASGAGATEVGAVAATVATRNGTWS